MKNKNRKKKEVFFYFLVLLLLAGFFGFGKDAFADQFSHLLINEIMLGQTEATKNEFIELYNPTAISVDLGGFKLKKKTKSSVSETYLVSSFSGFIAPYGYFLISSPEYKDVIRADFIYSGVNYSIASDNTLFLYDNLGNLLDKVGYGEAADFETQATVNPPLDQSIERTNFQDSGNNFSDFLLKAIPTPQNSSYSKPETDLIPEPTPLPNLEPESIIYSDEIRINELLPNPAAGKEFVEFYNSGDETVNLENWRLRDANLENKTAANAKDYSCVLPKIEIEAKKYKVFYLTDCGKNSIALNNDGDVLNLYNPLVSEFVSKTEYAETAGKDRFWSFNGENWLWSSIPTERKENQFDPETPPEPEPDPEPEPVPEPEPIEYSDQIIINEILPAPQTGDREFVEFYNSGDETVNLENWRLKDANLEKTSTAKKNKNCILPALEIAPKNYAVFYLENCAGKEYAVSLNNAGGDELNLYNPTDMLSASGVAYAEDALSGHSYSFDGADWRWTSQATPGEGNKFDKPEEAALAGDPIDGRISACAGQICLSEILPNPKDDEVPGEYVEIYNSSETDAGIGGWILKDKSSKKYVFPDNAKIGAGNYLLVYRTDFKFAMNNSGQETISLLDKDGKIASSVSYNGAKKNVSYNFDGAFWHWSRFLTPKKENRFNHAPKIKINRIKNAYAGMPITFKASVKDKDGDKLKYVWNFGDGHKSYMKNPTHFYRKKGTYKIILTVDDGSEKFAKTLSVKVKDYPKVDIKIVRLSLNPAGNDTGNETISLFNNSKKKINLRGWKIATGKNKLVNHIIAENFIINPGKRADITRQSAYFYLNNTAMKLELRYPNGKTADKVAYKKEKIEDNEVYAKINGQWAWITPQAENKLAIAENPAENNPIIKYQDAEIQNNLGKYSEDPDWQKKKESRIILAIYDLKLDHPESQDRVPGAATVEATENYYSFTTPGLLEKHWSVKFIKNISLLLNSFLNKFFLNFS